MKNFHGLASKTLGGAALISLLALACSSDSTDGITGPAVGPAPGVAATAPLGSDAADPAVAPNMPAEGLDPAALLPGVSPECQTGVVAGRAPMRRLTRLEYNNTVKNLLATELRVADGFAPEKEVNGFLNNADNLLFEEILAGNYMKAAEELAADARARGLFGLDCAASGAPCATTFIQDFGRRAFRRVLEPAEVQDYLATYEQGVVAGGTFEDGLEWVVQRMLQSVNFLYRVEPLPADFDGASTSVKLPDHAIASRLSYFLWQTMPDGPLLDAADQGLLSTREQVEAQVQRMMADERFEHTLAQFHRQWITYGVLKDKLEPVEPEWGSITDYLAQEADLFIAELFSNGGTINDLFTADFSMLNADLATFYGVELPNPAQPGFQRVDGLPHRAGILTMPAFLAQHATNAESNPVKRGVAVRARLLCQPPPPPPNMAIEPPEPEPGVSTRERFEQHRANPVCAACHKLIDPVGMGFENYDEFGRYREMDEGEVVDASGELTNVTIKDNPAEAPQFVGVEELGDKIARTAEAPECMTEQWFRFTMARNIEAADKCALERMNAQMEVSGWQLSQVVTALTTSDVFRYRALEATQ